MLGRKLNLYSKCLPFAVIRSEAEARTESILKDYVKDYVKDTKKFEKELTAAYILVQLADLRWKMKVDCERGAFWYYQECIDWAWPRSIIYDIFLLDELSPWDYSELVPLKPAYLEGKVQLLASENLGEWQAKIPDWILQRTSPERLRKAFGLNEIELCWISRDIRKHNYGLVLLPVYAMEITLEKGIFLRVMINGQTGKAALQIASLETEYTRILEPGKKRLLSAESTILAPPIPIIYVKSTFLHKRVSFSEALIPKN